MAEIRQKRGGAVTERLVLRDHDTIREKSIEAERSYYHEGFLHIDSTCCGCSYEFSRHQAIQLRDYLTELIGEDQGDDDSES